MQFGWRTRPDEHVQRAASALFQEASGWQAPARPWLWSAAMAAWGVASFFLYRAPDAAARFADALAGVAPSVFAPGTDSPGMVEDQGFIVFAAAAATLAAGVNLWLAARHRRRLQAGFAAAEARLGAPFVAQPGQVLTALAFALFWSLVIGGPVVAIIWALVAMKAATGIAVRLIVAPVRERSGLAGRLSRGAVRGLGFTATLLLLGGLAVKSWIDGPASRVSQIPEGPPPALAQAWNDAVAGSLDGRGFVDANRILLEVARGVTDPALLASTRRTLEDARARDAAKWQALRDHRFTMAELVEGFDNAGLVPGGDGQFAFRILRGTDAERPGTSSLDVFDRSDSDGWRLSVRAGLGLAVVEPPVVLASPEGRLLVVPATSAYAGHSDASQLWHREGGAWRWIDTSAWLRAAAAALPPGECLLGAEYDGVSRAIPARSILRPDFATLRVSAPFGPDPHATPGPQDGRIEARLAIVDGMLTLKDIAITPPARRRPWLERLLADAPQC